MGARELTVEPSPKLGLALITPPIFRDGRGYFRETWNREKYAPHGVPEVFVQDNLSWSRRGCLRGMHFQEPDAQGKLVSVLRGAVWDVVVDVRLGSPTFRVWEAFRLSAENRRQLFVPEGFAHGFLVTSEEALFAYKVTGRWSPQAERGLLWNDSEVGIDWSELMRGDDGDAIGEPTLSASDAGAHTLRQLEEDGALPRFDD